MLKKSRLTMSPLSQTPFGVWLKNAREHRGLNQSDLADRCGATQEYISGLERGARNPSRRMVASIVQALRPEDASPETADTMLDEALSAAFGIRNQTAPRFSSETIRYAQVYENADTAARALLGEAQGLLVRTIMASRAKNARITLDELDRAMKYAEDHPESVRYFDTEQADQPQAGDGRQSHRQKQEKTAA